MANEFLSSGTTNVSLIKDYHTASEIRHTHRHRHTHTYTTLLNVNTTYAKALHFALHYITLHYNSGRQTYQWQYTCIIYTRICSGLMLNRSMPIVDRIGFWFLGIGRSVLLSIRLCCIRVCPSLSFSCQRAHKSSRAISIGSTGKRNRTKKKHTHSEKEHEKRRATTW